MTDAGRKLKRDAQKAGPGRTEIRLTGVGGQGVVLAGTILGRAAAIYDELNAVLTKEYGSDMRGGDVSTDLVLSGEKIVYPTVLAPDVMVTLAPRAFENNKKWLRDGVRLVYDAGLVHFEKGDLPKGCKALGVPFTALADGTFHRTDVANMVFLGFFTGVVRLLTADAVRKALADLLPPRKEKGPDVNLQAFELGLKEGEAFSHE
ncbi:MAG: 2-oxoacid:acceptor oxidoreductase family protein [Synergistaceae bacterium]|jgi:2-oxoglutarate ferredoxin oxidoreductase subunit gamma|nr:2-oxoacid:acceptor oxidoreductase family protein [Synergistaceae bacterium]